ncbi:aldo/keto reductase [Alteromonadaceae bacterium M269]|nr:aldo/keto reductase [Alteromonadaceae bacterium M269]
MQTRRLGRTGLSVSDIGHGLWGMGDWSDADNLQSAQALIQSSSEGCTFYDSAWAYGNGHSDKLLGSALRDMNNDAVVSATKVPPKNLQWPGKAEDAYTDVFPRDHVIEYAQKSREALGVTSIDLLQLHVWDDSWANSPVLKETVEELKQTGLIKHFGLSLNRWEPENGIEAITTGLVDTVQVIYNIFDQAPEDNLFPICNEYDVGVIARVPLDEGSLGGHLTKNTRFPTNDFRSMYFGPENLPETVDRVEALKEIVPQGMTLAEMAIRFILSNPAVSTMVIGMRQSKHIQSNIACSELGALPESLLEELKQHRWDRKPTSWSG